MPLLSGDIRFARSANMSDVPEGGGPPSAQLLTSGRSNEIFPDISEETRTVGRVEIYQIFGILRNADSAPLLGANVIVAEPPADPNVSIVMLSLKDPFATRADIARRIEAGMSAASEWSGYLLENHFATMRAVQFIQRPGMPTPTVGKTYVLVYQEGEPDERRQRVRIKSVSTTTRTFTESVNGTLVDFQAQVSTCEIFDGLLYDFPGSPPSVYYVRDAAKSMIRETVYTDSGMFYSATRIKTATLVTDTWIETEGIYTQIVPNSRTEAANVDRMPAAQRTLLLADAPRRVEVGITPHTQRVRVREENVGMVYVFLCKPLPAPGTLVLSFRVMGTWYTLFDDGAGALTGSGAGSVNYATGSVSVTVAAVPDIGSSIVLQWGENTAFTDRSGGASYRAPEFAWELAQKPIKPGSVTITWESGGSTRTVTDDGAGALSGAGGTGEINYATGQIFLRPAFMVDAGGEFASIYTYTSQITQQFEGITPDVGGFATLALAEVPAARSITVRWVTVRNVSASSGSTEVVSESATSFSGSVTSAGAGGYYLAANGDTKSMWYAPGTALEIKLGVPGNPHLGTYTWEVVDVRGFDGAAATLADGVAGATSGSVLVEEHTGGGAGASHWGKWTLTLASPTTGKVVRLRAKNAADTIVAERLIEIEPSAAARAPQPVPATAVRTGTGVAAIAARVAGGVNAAGDAVYVIAEPLYDDTYGFCYDAPRAVNPPPLWSAAELAAKQKALLSERGATTTYKIWE